MILINVLPDHLRPVKQTPVPYIAAALAIGLAVFMVGSIFIGVMANLSGTNNEIAETEQAIKDLEDIVNEHNALTEEQIRLQSKIETIEEILSDRKIWSEHLHKLALLAPENLWYSGIRTSMERFQRRVPKFDKDGKPMLSASGEQQMERKTVSLPVLEVSGYVIADESGLRNINPLTDSTTEDEQFTRHFKLDRPSIEDTEFNGYAVRGFTLQYLINANTGGDES